jgi:hypothetical protein
MLDTKIRYGQKLWDAEDENKEHYINMNWIELTELGYAVKSCNSPESYGLEKFWLPRQKCFYVIIRRTKNSSGLNYEAFRKAKQQNGLIVEHDPIRQRIRIKGSNVLAASDSRIDSGVSDWVCYGDDKYKAKVRKSKMTLEEYRMYIKNKMYGGGWKPEVEYQPIEEIPIMITHDKYIVCIRKERICQRILCTGASRKGKSTFANAVAGRILYTFQDRVGWMIDPQNQFYDLSLPQDYSEFNKINSWINNPPTPIPAIHLYLACKNPAVIAHKNISLKLTLDFHEFLNKFGFYSNGAKSWQLDKPEKYLRGVTLHIKDVKTIKELNDKLCAHLPNANDPKKGDAMKQMIYKWIGSFRNIFNERFTSNLYQNDPIETHELEVQLSDGTTMKGHPFIMAMEAGVVPIINTSMVPEKPWVRNYMADVMKKLMMHQKVRGQAGKRHRIFVVVDEMQEIFEKKSGIRMDNASIAFEKLFRQGGQQDIGFIGNTQSLEKLNDDMVKNASHICAVYTQSATERNMIRKIFDLPKEITDQLATLNVQEMMIFSREPFVVYDRWGRRKVVTDRNWFKGRIIPPINYHKAPKLED